MSANAFTLGGLIPLGNSDINANDPVVSGSTMNMGKNRGGQLGFMIDQSGLKMFRYVQNRKTSGAYTQGDLVSRVGGATGVTAVSSPVASTTTRITSSSTLTANQHIGALLYIKSVTSNAAPQGETAPIVSHGTTNAAITIDSKYPFSASGVGATITADILGTYNTIASAANDTVASVMGVVVGSDGIDNGNFGWAQSWGFTPLATYSGAVTVNASLKAGAGVLVTVVASGAKIDPPLMVGYAPLVVTAAATKSPAWMTLDFGVGFFNTTAGLFSF